MGVAWRGDVMVVRDPVIVLLLVGSDSDDGVAREQLLLMVVVAKPLRCSPLLTAAADGLFNTRYCLKSILLMLARVPV